MLSHRAGVYGERTLGLDSEPTRRRMGRAILLGVSTRSLIRF